MDNEDIYATAAAMLIVPQLRLGLPRVQMKNTQKHQVMKKNIKHKHQPKKHQIRNQERDIPVQNVKKKGVTTTYKVKEYVSVMEHQSITRNVVIQESLRLYYFIMRIQTH